MGDSCPGRQIPDTCIEMQFPNYFGTAEKKQIEIIHLNNSISEYCTNKHFNTTCICSL